MFMCVNSYAQNNNPFPNLKSAPRISKLKYWDPGFLIWKEAYNNHYKYYKNLASEQISISYNGKDTFYRYTYIYDNSDQLITTLNDKYDSITNKFVPGYRNSYSTKNIDGLEKFSLYEYYDTLTNSYIPSNKDHKVYNNNGELILSISEFYDGSKWKITSGFKYEFTIIQEGDIKKETILHKTYKNGFFIIYSKEENQYNLQGLLINTTSFSYIDSNWIPFYKNEIEYQNNRPFRIYKLEYDQFLLKFNYIEIKDSIIWDNYDKNINPLSQIPISYINAYFSAPNVLGFMEKYSTTIIDNNGSFVNKIFKWEGNMWNEYERTSTYFDQHKNKIVFKIEQPINGNLKLIGEAKFQNTYTNNNLIKIEQSYLDTLSNTYILVKVYDYEDYVLISSSPSIQNSVWDLIAYPNPTSGIIKLNLADNTHAKIDVMNNMGVLLRTYYSQNNQIDLQDLPNGIYFLKIEALDKTYTQRIIIQH